MDDNEILRRYKELEDWYGAEKLPDPIHEPIRFGMYVKMFNHYMQRNKRVQQ